MAINDFKNIENINLNLDSTAQLIESKDLKIFKTGVKNITDFGMSKNDVIEFRIYDISNNLLEQTNGIKVRYIYKNDLSKYLKSDIDPITQEKIFDIDVEKLVRESGYGNGQFKVSFNFLKNIVGTNNENSAHVWIHEVSPSRSEIRVMPLIGLDANQNKHITHRYNALLDGGRELIEIIDIIKNTIDLIEINISDLIDTYFISKHGKAWLDKITSDYKFNNLSYTAFKQKIYSDFKKGVINALNSNTYDLYEFYGKTEIYTLLTNKLSDAIELNAKSIVQYDIPQVVKDYTKTKVDDQILQSLLDTNYTSKSNLTNNNKLGKLKADVVVVDTTIDDIVYDNPTYPNAGTLLKTYCKGYDQWGTYANGNGGTYDQIIEIDSSVCGYVIPGGRGGGGGGSRGAEYNTTIPGGYNNWQIDGPLNQDYQK